MPLLLAKQNHGFASWQGRGKPLHANDAIVRYATYKTYITQNHGFVLQMKLSTQTHYVLLDVDTCFTPEAQSWTDLNYRL